MKTYTLTAFVLVLTTLNASASTKVVNMTGCTLQLFNENNNNAALTLALNPLSPALQQSTADQSYPSYTVEEQAIKVNIGAYNTWECDNYISTYHVTGLTDDCVEVYTNILPTTPGESSVPGELLVRPCRSSAKVLPSIVSPASSDLASSPPTPPSPATSPAAVK